MKKWFVWGLTVGFVAGLIIELFFPEILLFDAIFNIKFRQATLLPIGELPVAGSTLSAGTLFPITTAIIGGGVGVLCFYLFKTLSRHFNFGNS